MTEAKAEEASRWPILLFTEPTIRGERCCRGVLYTLLIAENSIGSPAAVPVP